MRVPRVWVNAPLRPPERVELPPDEARHVALVLRRHAGDPVVLLSPQGAFAGAIAEVAPLRAGARVVVDVLGVADAPAPAGLPWTVACGVTRGDSFELAIRMAAELGLEAVLPLLTRRTVVRDAGPSRRRRWERIAAEAGKQCGRTQPLEVLEPASFSSLVEEAGGGEGGGGEGGGWEERRGGSPGRWIALPGESLPRLPAGAARNRALFLVGPEGGFSPEEAAAALGGGFEPLGFPCPVLRTPTAVALIAALGVVLGEWEPKMGGNPP